MTVIKRDDLVVARQRGTRLLLAGGLRTGAQFEGPSERTFFFAKDEAEGELKRMKIPLDRIDLRPAALEMTIR
jgi:hypothetical protein